MISSKYFDHTILKAEATETQVAKICDEALANDFASVCVNPVSYTHLTLPTILRV